MHSLYSDSHTIDSSCSLYPKLFDHFHSLKQTNPALQPSVNGFKSHVGHSHLSPTPTLSCCSASHCTCCVKGNEDNIVAQHTRMVDQLSHVAAKGSRKPASRSNRNSSIIKSGSTPSRSRENSVLIEPSRANKLQDKHRVGNLARRTSIEPKKSRQNSVTCDTGEC